MLIDLWLNPNKNNLSFDLPPVIFHNKQKVCVSRLYIKWHRSVTNPSIILSSTLTEKSSLNPAQQLLFVYQKGKSQVLNYTPTHRQYYKIQCLELQASQFNLTNIDNSELEKIDQIYIQLEIE